MSTCALRYIFNLQHVKQIYFTLYTSLNAQVITFGWLLKLAERVAPILPTPATLHLLEFFKNNHEVVGSKHKQTLTFLFWYLVYGFL